MTRSSTLTKPVAVRAPVDPRIRRRRIEVRREEGRRRLRALLGATALSAAVAGGWGTLHSPLLDVDRVVVAGAARLSPAEVRAAAGIAPGTALVDVDPQAVARRVEALGWAGPVAVERRWPGTVVVSVVERPAVAVTRADGEAWVLLDPTGRVLDVVAERPAGPVLLEGVEPGGAEPGRVLEAARGALAVAAALPAGLRPEVVAVVAATDGIDVRLRVGGVARLGPPERIPEKLRALQTVLARAGSGGIATIDLRQPASPALTRPEPSRTVSTLSTG